MLSNPIRHRTKISIHAPHAGSDQTREMLSGGPQFQSTLPMRGATGTPLTLGILAGLFQSTLPMRGATVKQKTLNPCGIQHIILRTS